MDAPLNDDLVSYLDHSQAPVVEGAVVHPAASAEVDTMTIAKTHPALARQVLGLMEAEKKPLPPCKTLGSEQGISFHVTGL
jgi:hypothetical protein